MLLSLCCYHSPELLLIFLVWEVSINRSAPQNNFSKHCLFQNNYRSVHLGLDPSIILSKLKVFVKNNPLDVDSANVLAILLGKLFEASPHTNYSSIVDLALIVFESGKVQSLAAGVLVCPMLHVMSFPSPMTADMWTNGVKLMKMAVKKFENDKRVSGKSEAGMKISVTNFPNLEWDTFSKAYK